MDSADDLVVKVCNDEGDGHRFDSLIKEVEILKRLKNRPHLCNYVDFYEDLEGLFLGYLVMTHAGSMNLQEFIQTPEYMTKENLGSLSWQLLTALSHTHASQVCHRDVKPDNIIIRSRGASSGFYLTLIDFNVAVCTDGEGPISGDFGVKEWSAPETRSKTSYTEVSDMWSYACVLYFMYTGGNEMFPLENSIEEKLE